MNGVRLSDEVRDHSSCMSSTPFTSLCMSTGIFASTSSCWPVTRGIYDDVNGHVTRHEDDMALILSAQDTRSQGVRSPIWSGLQEWTLLRSKGA